MRYAKGTRYWFLVEIRPEDSPPAEKVQRIEQGGLVGFRFQEAGRSVLLLHNPSDQPAQADVPKGAIYDQHEPKSRPAPAGPLRLEPHRHAVHLGG